MGRFSENFVLTDRLRYFIWRLTGARNTFEGRFNNGPRISIRPATTDDFNTAYEIFRSGIYDTGLTPASVHRIVDLGANVGYSCLLWCWRFPAATVVAFEPHPLHLGILDWHLRVNGYSDRVQVIRAGAASAAGGAALTDQGYRSTVLKEPARESVLPGPGTNSAIRIELVDFFDAVGDEPIDILKVDIEGSEYALLDDPRFDRLAPRIRCIAMEWHARSASHYGGPWCIERLEKLGFKVTQLPALSPDLGMLIAHAGKL